MLKQRIYALLSIAALVLAMLAVPRPVEARITRVVLLVTVTTAASTAFTSDTTIFSRKISFQADSTNAATGYVGDTSLDATSATTLRNTAMASLGAGSGWTPTISEYEDSRGQTYRLSDFRCSGTTNDKIRLVYEVPVTP